VVPDQTVVVSAFNLQPEATGDAVVNKYFCASSGTKPKIDVSAPGEAGAKVPADCTPGDAGFQVDDLTPFRTGADGSEVLTLGVGTHTITEACFGVSAELTVEEGKETTINVLNFKDMEGSDCPAPGQLPNTGTGATAGRHDATLLLLLAMGSLALMCGGALFMRRPGAVRGTPYSS
jgi:hypothetical protein